jgi:hypothetical protein
VPGGAVRIAIGAVLAPSPVLTALGLLGLAAWRNRRRATAIAWQVRLTDAISTELGGVVAPVVSKPPGARWRVAMRVPVARPALVSGVLAITHETRRDLRIARYELVLTPAPAPARRGESTAPEVRRTHVARVPSARLTAVPRIYGGAPAPAPAGRAPRRGARPRRSSLATR